MKHIIIIIIIFPNTYCRLLSCSTSTKNRLHLSQKRRVFSASSNFLVSRNSPNFLLARGLFNTWCTLSVHLSKSSLVTRPSMSLLGTQDGTQLMVVRNSSFPFDTSANRFFYWLQQPSIPAIKPDNFFFLLIHDVVVVIREKKTIFKIILYGPIVRTQLILNKLFLYEKDYFKMDNISVFRSISYNVTIVHATGLFTSLILHTHTHTQMRPKCITLCA